MLRELILAMSRSRTGERVATNVPGLRRFSRRFVAGNTQADVIDAVRRLNAAGFDATVSFLGESVTSELEVQAALREFTSFLETVKTQGLRSHLSVKLTELGLAFDPDLARRALDIVLARASDAGTFVRVDMEDSRYTQATLDLVREARRTHDNAGAVIQACLYRSDADIRALAAEGTPVRLVKGAYREPSGRRLPGEGRGRRSVRAADRCLPGEHGARWRTRRRHTRCAHGPGGTALRGDAQRARRPHRVPDAVRHPR